jgi:hypothetical protein
MDRLIVSLALVVKCSVVLSDYRYLRAGTSLALYNERRGIGDCQRQHYFASSNGIVARRKCYCMVHAPLRMYKSLA